VSKQERTDFGENLRNEREFSNGVMENTCQFIQPPLFSCTRLSMQPSNAKYELWYLAWRLNFTFQLVTSEGPEVQIKAWA
jgi:hypothetical protein